MGEKPFPITFRLTATTYFLTYKGISDSGQRLSKDFLASYLLHLNPNDRKLKPIKYRIGEQMYDDGTPHLHAILIYPKRKQVTTPTYYDVLGIHPNIQTIRNYKAALQYVQKEDPHPITNMDLPQERRVARAKDSSSLYELLQEQMLKDPYTFDVNDYCRDHGIFKQIYKANYTKAINLLRRAQYAQDRGRSRELQGVKFITPELVQDRLSDDQISEFYSHPCYQRIIDHINQIYRYPNRSVNTMAPSKTPHLLITGPASIGKSALVDHRPTSQYPHPGLASYMATYHLSIGQKFFPPYRSWGYRLVRWNQFTIASDMFPKSGYNRLLDYLEGAPSALPQKGRPPVERQDNPKHIMTSNRSLEEHICKTFNSKSSRDLSRMNLGTRVDCVIVPSGKDLHFLRKLFIPPLWDK